MSVIDRYVSREIIRFCAIVLLGALGLYLVVDFFRRIDNFIEAGLALSRARVYFQLKLPQMVAEITPFSILLGVLIALGLMKKNNEILALRCSGVNTYFLLRPALRIGLASTIFLFLLSELVVHVTLSKANQIWWQEVKKKSAVTLKQKDIWIKGDRSIYNIAYYNPQTKTIFKIALNYLDKDFRLIKRIDAREAVFRDGKWVFFDVIEQKLDQQDGSYKVASFKEHTEPVDFLPDDLMRVIKNPEEMNVMELYAFIQDVASEGYDTTVYWVDFFNKFAYPFVCLIMSIIATGIAVMGMGRGQANLFTSIVSGLVMVFFYWVLHSFCLSLGYAGKLPPLLAAWLANIVFGMLALFILLNTE
jgi:lipopolysaccharide export system permease protein